MLIVRIFCVFSAVFLVGAVALALLGPPDQSLSELLAGTSHGWLGDTEAFVHRHLSRWVWESLIVPVLVRPVWLVPAGLGLICAGLAISLTGGRGTSRSHRWRS